MTELNDTNTCRLFDGALPTAADVDRLRKRWPERDLKPGDTIAYAEVADIIREPARSNRWRTVTVAWRRVMERETDGRVVLDCRDADHFVVLDDAEKLDLAADKKRGGVKMIKRSGKLTTFCQVANLSEDDRERLLFHQQHAAALVAVGLTRSIAKLPAI